MAENDDSYQHQPGTHFIAREAVHGDNLCDDDPTNEGHESQSVFIKKELYDHENVENPLENFAQDGPSTSGHHVEDYNTGVFVKSEVFGHEANDPEHQNPNEVFIPRDTYEDDDVEEIPIEDEEDDNSDDYGMNDDICEVQVEENDSDEDDQLQEILGRPLKKKRKRDPNEPKRLDKIMTRISPKQCKVCLQMFETRYECTQHKNLFHNEHECEVCHKVFRGVNGLKNRNAHMRNFHLEKKLLKCEFCDKAFPYQALLTAHLTIKHQVRKNECHVCSKKFHYESQLRRHLERHEVQANKKVERKKQQEEELEILYGDNIVKQ